MIESSQNKTIKLINSLKTKKDRDRLELFVAEGLRFVEEIPNDYEIVLYAVSKSFSDEYDVAMFEKRAVLYVVEDKLFKEISDTSNPQGILAVIKQKKISFEQVIDSVEENEFFIMAEELNDPGNLGTIVRTADACGCNGVFLSKGSVDVYNPKVLRSTMGSVFHIPVISDVDLEECSRRLKAKNIAIYAAHLQGQQYVYSFNLTNGCAFIVGNEARGLSEKIAKLADVYVKIPMLGKAESLNASIAAGVLMYEVVRQRL
ncbi:MAG TPA: 23S rRNA (guanosine(2251)-2'-O)-methyltransferase RlmB [Lachnospiraceae bacterium]|nr:23S rRNA (guanosine(2251)-2'-O)-methyltransferase RlmB [Lachnospiraceae bacterium]